MIIQIYLQHHNLTLTSVVFEYEVIYMEILFLSYLTLTSVVFELVTIIFVSVALGNLILTSVVQKNKSCNKENFSMLQLFLLIL